MQSSLGYILRTRPYSDSNTIVDVFTQQAGRITCMARPAKLRGKIQKGHLQPFRVLQLHWQGRGELQRLNQTDERYRHRVPAPNLLYGLYLNELILRLIPQHHPVEQLYSDYQNALQQLVEATEPMLVLMRFELQLMQTLGHELNVWVDDDRGAPIQEAHRYLYVLGSGVLPYSPDQPSVLGVMITGQLLQSLRDPATMTLPDCHALRKFLDSFWRQLYSKPLNSRKLLQF